jgi:hypothetical protein
MAVVVNDGLRQKMRYGGSWQSGLMRKVVSIFGNDLFGQYDAVCRMLMIEKAAQAGYRLDGWTCYYTGHAAQMTHYLALLSRQ